MIKLIDEGEMWRLNRYSVDYDESDVSVIDLGDVRILGNLRCFPFMERLERYVSAMQDGIKFPPVFLVPMSNSYELRLTQIADHHSWSFRDEVRRANYGGHHRALASYFSGEPLRAVIVSDPEVVKKADRIETNYPGLLRNLKPIEETIFGYY